MLIAEKSLSDKFLFFEKLKAMFILQMPTLFRYIENANDPERVKLLLTWKKEVAITEIRELLVFVKAKPDVVEMYMRTLPVYFSHSTLHDSEVESVMKILTILRLHPSFVKEEDIFDQWYQVFRRRVTSKKFTYKDESCVRNLPIVANFNSEFAHCIGYVDIHLFRNFHRWLRLLRLHKYLFLFANMSYEQIMSLNAENFEEYEKQLNIVKVTAGAKAKIIREIERLRQRRQNLEQIFKTPLSDPTEIENVVRDLKRILRTPIPMEDVLDEDLPKWIVWCFHKIFRVIVTSSNFDEFVEAIYGLYISLLKEAWNYNIFSAEDKNSFNEWRAILSDTLLKKQRVNVAEPLNRPDSLRGRLSPFLTQEETAPPPDFVSFKSLEDNACVPGIENMIGLFSNLSMIDAITNLNNTRESFSYFNQSYVPNSFPKNQYAVSEGLFVPPNSHTFKNEGNHHSDTQILNTA